MVDASPSKPKYYGEIPDPTLPTLPEPPESYVLAALREVPLIFACNDFTRLRVERNGGEPLHFLLGTIIERRQHAQPAPQLADHEPAAQWAIRQLVDAGLLIVKAQGTQAVVIPTEALWAWWRESGRVESEIGRTDGAIAEQIADSAIVKPLPKRKSGRPRDTDPDEDQQVADAWATGQHRSKAALASALGAGWTAKKVTDAIDRHRKRRERNGSKPASDK